MVKKKGKRDNVFKEGIKKWWWAILLIILLFIVLVNIQNRGSLLSSPSCSDFCLGDSAVHCYSDSNGNCFCGEPKACEGKCRNGSCESVFEAIERLLKRTAGR